MDVNFSEEQKLIKSSAREFLKAEVPKDVVRELEESEEGYSPGLWQKIAELGWIGLNIPEEYDGMGMNFLDLVILLEEVGYNLLPGPFFSTVIAAFPIILGGREEKKKEYLPKIAEGKLRMSLALTEPTATFDPLGIEMEAVAEGDAYILNGTKLFVEYAHTSDALVAVARTGTGERPEDGLSLFIIDAKAPGVRISNIPTIGLDRQCEVQFTDVRIPNANMVGPADRGWDILKDTLHRAQVGKCAEMLGGMKAALDMTNTYVKKRMTYGKSVASYQVVQHYLADVWIDVETSKNLFYLAAWKICEGIPCGKEVAAAKAWVGKAFTRVTERCVQMHGAIGLTREHDIGLYYRNAKACDLAFGDSQYQREVIAGEMC
ncbi:MAG: acyl-CoA/acyl-ACP dehydrogenase [Deltaproteobacteria bacterium]|nr:acyl-CoA/acyl-ACP dehydrogenase [Deltaproteobacteria bacterium]